MVCELTDWDGLEFSLPLIHFINESMTFALAEFVARKAKRKKIKQRNTHFFARSLKITFCLLLSASFFVRRQGELL